jgi:hypothetical protein
VFSFQCPLADPWIVPIIQGFVQIEHCKVEIGFDPAVNEALEPRYEVSQTYVCQCIWWGDGGWLEEIYVIAELQMEDLMGKRCLGHVNFK